MSKKKIIYSAFLVTLLWGTLFPMVKLGYVAFNIVSFGDILLFAGIRFTICGATICIYTFITDRKSFTALKTSIIPVLLSGLFSIILHYAFTYSALRLTDSSKTAILNQTGVLFYMCFSVFFFKEDRLTIKKLICVLLGLSGIIVINSNSGSIRFNIGDALIIASSFCTIFATIISKKIFSSIKPVTSTGISQLFGGVVLLIAGIIMGGSINITFSTSAFIMIYICTASIFSYAIWFSTVKNTDLSKLFIIKFAEPIFACIFGALLLKENIFKIQYLIAFMLISAGIYISNK